jgi:hypothetical protein
VVARPDWGEEMRQDLLACPPDILVIPNGSIFPVDWQDDVVPGYERRSEYDDSVVLTQPKLPLRQRGCCRPADRDRCPALVCEGSRLLANEVHQVAEGDADVVEV